MKVCRRETFNAAHRLFRPEWSDAENLEVFGKCSHPNFHGHNYVIEVWIEGPVDPLTGFVMDLKLLKTVIQEQVTHRFDHRNLNLDCPEFEGVIPTTENIAIVCWNLLRAALPEHLGIEVHIQETQKNKAVYAGK